MHLPTPIRVAEHNTLFPEYTVELHQHSLCILKAHNHITTNALVGGYVENNHVHGS